MVAVPQLKWVHRLAPSAGQSRHKGAAIDSSAWEGGRRKRKPMQGIGLCKVLKVSVKESGAGQDGMRQCQVSGKAKEKGRSSVITISSPNKAAWCFCSLSLSQDLLLPSLSAIFVSSSSSSSPHPVPVHYLCMCWAFAECVWGYIAKSGVCSLH